MGTLGTHFHLAQLKNRDLLARLREVDFSAGAISQAHGKVALALAEPLREMAVEILRAPAKHMDETRYPREGTSNWVWAVDTPMLVWCAILPSRARYVASTLLGEQFSGILVSDRFACQCRDLWDCLHESMLAWINNTA